MAVVTIARQYGAGAGIVGKRVAEQLGCPFYDREVLHQVAHKAHVAVKTVREIEQTAGDGLLGFVEELVSSMPLIRGAPGVATDFDEEKLRIFLTRIIREIARRERAVIIGRGGQLILKDHPKTVRIYLTAELDDRIESLMKERRLDRGAAENQAIREEKRRLGFLKGFAMGNPEDPMLYHLIINTSLVPPGEAAELILLLADKADRGALSAR